jgi:hypothetical protein
MIFTRLLSILKGKQEDNHKKVAVPEIGMITSREREWLFSYAGNTFQGNGAVVDLGSWFGSTTCALAEGLLSNPSLSARKKSIHAFDQFIWEPWMEPIVKNTAFEGFFKKGDDFVEAFKQQTKKYENQIILSKVDLTKYEWQGERIEFLLIDAMKSWSLANHIIQCFYPFLIPGKSVVLHQDFSHFFTYWIHLIQYRMKDYFTPQEDVIKYNSLAFDLIKPIPTDLISRNYSLADFSPEEIEAAFSYSRSLVAPENLPHIDAANIMAVKDKMGKDHALPLFHQLTREYPEHDTVRILLRFFPETAKDD